MYQGTLPENYSDSEYLSPVETLQERKILLEAIFLDMETQINNVINMTSRINGKPEIVVMEVQNFYEVTLIVQALRERKTIFLDLTLVSAEMAQRIVDFLAGSAYATDGEQTCIGENVFVLTPDAQQFPVRDDRAIPSPFVQQE